MRLQEIAWPVIRVVAAVYVGLSAWLYLRQGRYVYYPSKAVSQTPGTAALTFEDVQVATADGVRIHGWYVPGADAGRTILFCHGNAGNIWSRIDLVWMYHAMGYSVCVFDYRGYGKSEGTPTEEGTYRDAEAVWGWLTGARGIAPGGVVIHGESLGGAVAAWLASRTSPGALVLESTFTSLPDMAARLYPFLPARWLCRFRYSTIDYLKGVRCPVLVAHGRDDEMIPYAFGRRLYEAAGGPKVFFELKGSHNTGREESGREYEAALKAFIERAIPAGEAPVR